MALPLSVALAFAMPGVGAAGGPLRSEWTTRLGVALIFLFQGLLLPTSALRSGTARWPLHALVQGFTFVGFPVLGLALDALMGRFLTPDLRLGFLFLCVLPSTVSSSVVMTSLAGGNTVGAIFNAALSNVLGVFVTPLWVAWLMKSGGTQPDLGAVVREIAVLLILPLVVGQGLRWKLAGWADARKRLLGNASSVLILFLVYAAFCNSVQSRFWSGLGSGVLWTASAGVGVIFALVMALVFGAARVARLDRGDRIAAAFCAPQKTIAAGIPLAKAIFGSHPGLGLILLPVLLYHPLQLIVCGLLADRWGRENHVPPGQR
jgi:solute carrier family 10 (sodium/bile acid cotransporter), member 7